MATPMFCEIFGDFISAELKENLSTAALKKCNLDPDTRTLSAGLYCDTYISRTVVSEVVNTLKTLLKLEKCEITVVFCDLIARNLPCYDP